jgi:hypothetical protein
MFWHWIQILTASGKYNGEVKLVPRKSLLQTFSFYTFGQDCLCYLWSFVILYEFYDIVFLFYEKYHWKNVMKMGHSFTNLYLLKFLSLVLSGFYDSVLLPPWLNLFLSILILKSLQMEMFSWLYFRKFVVSL